MDLREALWGTDLVGARRLLALLRNLPPDSASARALDPNEGWTQDQELMATVVDMLGVLEHRMLWANTKPNTKLPDPVTFPRPNTREVKELKRAPSSYDEVRAFFSKKSETGEMRYGA